MKVGISMYGRHKMFKIFKFFQVEELLKKYLMPEAGDILHFSIVT